MKTLVLCICMFLLTCLSAQNIYRMDFTSLSGSKAPDGWVVSSNTTVDDYRRPYGCDADEGLVTPGVGKNAPTRMILPTWTFDATLPVIYINFNVYVFDANLNCASVKDFPCSTYVTAMLIKDSYAGGINELPQPSEIYDQQSYLIQDANGNNTIIFNTPPIAYGAKYRLYLDFKTAESANCVSTGTKFVFDDFVIDKGICTGPCVPVANADYFEAGAQKFFSVLKGNVFGGYNLWSSQVAAEYATRSLATPPAVNSGVDYDANNHPMEQMNFVLVPGSTTVSARGCVTPEDGGVQLVFNNNGTFECTRNSICVERVTFQYKIIDPTAQESPVTTVTIDFPPNSALPVVFSAFTAARLKDVVALKWQTASEQSNRGFYVQRNTTGAWKDVAFVFSQADGGNSTSMLDYAYNDRNAFSGLSQYRVLQVDFDGRSRYSDVRAVRGEEQKARVIIYPNPSSTGSVDVFIEETTPAPVVELMDVQGRVLRRWSSVSGVLRIGGLSQGLYLLRVGGAGGNGFTTDKILITQ